MIIDWNNFKPCLLVATPELDDEYFGESVIALAEFHADQGALGFILNYPLDVTLQEAAVSAEQISSAYHPEPLWFGGPVEADTIYCIYQHTSINDAPESHRISENLSIAHSSALRADRSKPQLVKPCRLFAGHAGWSPNQLEEEIKAGSWFILPLDESFFFTEQHEDLWKQCLAKLHIPSQNATSTLH